MHRSESPETPPTRGFLLPGVPVRPVADRLTWGCSGAQSSLGVHGWVYNATGELTAVAIKSAQVGKLFDGGGFFLDAGRVGLPLA